MTEQKKRDTGTHSFTADSDGRYSYCFSNEMSTVTGKTVRYAQSFLPLVFVGVQHGLAREEQPHQHACGVLVEGVGRDEVYAATDLAHMCTV